MKKISITKDGFSAPEGLAIVCLIVIIFAVSTTLLNNNSTASIILKRQKYVDKYVSGLNIYNYTDLGDSLKAAGYLTNSLYNTEQSLANSYTDGSFSSNPAYATIVCVNEIPKSYTYGKVYINSSSSLATIPINVYTSNSIEGTPYIATWINSNGTWLLNSVDCSPH